MSKIERIEYILFFEEIVCCLVKYGKLEQLSARNILENSTLFNLGENYEDDLLFHESPYYWAMFLLYDNVDHYWYKNPLLWPPPDDYLETWRTNIPK